MDTPFPYPTLFRSHRHQDAQAPRWHARLVEMRHRARVHDRGRRVAIFVAEIGADQLAFLIADRSAVEIEQRLDLVLRSEEHTSELQSLMRISYAVFCLQKKKNTIKLT